MLYDFDIIQPMIFAVTGHTEAIFSERALDSGMNLVLFKPVDGKQLNALLIKLGFVQNFMTFRSELQEEENKSDWLEKSCDIPVETN